MLIQCKCGCGVYIEEFDKWKRKRKYIRGHNMVGWSIPEKQRLALIKINTGRIKTIEEKNKIRIALTGRIQREESKEKRRLSMRGKNKGENSSNWAGGITPLVYQIRHDYQYISWRNAIFKRDNYTCQYCDVRGGNLEAHHKQRFSDIMIECNIININDALLCKKLWDINNGITLCKKCHGKYKQHDCKRNLCIEMKAN